MRTIIAGFALVILSAGPLFAQNPDAVVFSDGDVRITGAGNGLVFPDNTVQTTAAGPGSGSTLKAGQVSL